MNLTNILEHEKVLCSSQHKLETKNIARTYDIRLKLKKSENIWKETWDNWEMVVSKLFALEAPDVLVSSVLSKDKLFLVFINIHSEKLVGIIWVPNEASVEEACSYNDKIIGMGLTVSQELYDKMVFQRDWREDVPNTNL